MFINKINFLYPLHHFSVIFRFAFHPRPVIPFMYSASSVRHEIGGAALATGPQLCLVAAFRLFSFFEYRKRST
jgi:hypothetical protein